MRHLFLFILFNSLFYAAINYNMESPKTPNQPMRVSQKDRLGKLQKETTKNIIEAEYAAENKFIQQQKSQKISHEN